MMDPGKPTLKQLIADPPSLTPGSPDAKSRDEPIWAPFAHWIQGGYLPSDAGAPIDGKPLLEYMGPAPPEGTGPHRYVVLLYREPVSAELQSLDKEDRKNFDIEGFVAKNKLELVRRGTGGRLARLGADPLLVPLQVGANFFYSESKSED